MPASDYPAYLDIDQQQWVGRQIYLSDIRIDGAITTGLRLNHGGGGEDFDPMVSLEYDVTLDVRPMMFVHDTGSGGTLTLAGGQSGLGFVADRTQRFQDDDGFLALAPFSGGTPVIGATNAADPPASGAIGKVNRTAQSAAVASTKLTDATPAGYYLVHYTVEDTTADIVAGTIQFQINYTDDIGATTQAGATLALTATGRDRGSFNVYVASGDISYQTNLVGIIGTARYALRVRCTYLG